jgi:hypothetical protein
MVDLSEFTGDDALRASAVKKRDKAQAKLDDIIAKTQLRIAPLHAEIRKFNDIIFVLDSHAGAKDS